MHSEGKDQEACPRLQELLQGHISQQGRPSHGGAQVLLSHPFQYIFPLSFSPHLLVCYFSSTVRWETGE